MRIKGLLKAGGPGGTHPLGGVYPTMGGGRGGPGGGPFCGHFSHEIYTKSPFFLEKSTFPFRGSRGHPSYPSGGVQA